MTPTLTWEQLTDVANQILGRTKKIMEAGEHPVPVTFFLDDKGGIVIMATPWEDRKQKALMEAALRHLIQEKQPAGVIRVADAWEADDGPLLPAHDPDRREIILINLKLGDRTEDWAVPYDRATTGIVFHELKVLDTMINYFWHPELPQENLL